MRLKASQTHTNMNETIINETINNDTEDVHQQRGETKFSMPKVIDPEPIKALDLLSKIQKVAKYESFIGNLFIGKFDTDFMAWPILLKHRSEFLSITQQYEMIRQTWGKVNKDENTMNVLGFNKLHSLTVSEMIHVFEAIGAATYDQLDFTRFSSSASDFTVTGVNNDIKHVLIPENAKFLSSEVSHDEDLSMKSIAHSLISLIIRNALSAKLISSSSNNTIKEMIMKSEEMPKIAFAFCEPQNNLGSLPYTQWNSTAKISNDLNHWLINGEKSKIYHDDYDFYAIFCRTFDVPERLKRPQYSEWNDTDDGIVAFLLPKNMVNVQSDGIDNFGLRYQKITFSDLLLSREKYELIPPQLNPTIALNIKGMGQIATSAVILGIIKQSLKNTYDYLINEKVGLLECESIQHILMKVSQRIYTIESILYLTAAMFDAFESGADCHLESLTVKTLATELAYDTIHDLRSLYGSRYLLSSSVHDLINLFDSFLDCSVNNRMYLALRGFKTFGVWRHHHIRQLRLGPLYPIYNIKYYIKSMRNRNDNVKLDLDICGYLHPNLKPGADWLEYGVKRLEYATELSLAVHGKDIVKKQLHLNRIAKIVMNCYAMTCVLSRSSNAYCKGLKNGDAETEIALSICLDSFLRIRRTMDDLSGQFKTTNDYRIPIIHNRNLKFNGYFPSSTLDRIV